MKKYRLPLLFLLTTIFLLQACGADFKAETDYPVEKFEATNHRGETITSESLKGKTTLAYFMFTNCETVCQPMTFNMSGIQEQLEKEKVDNYQIVAFSVDPVNDTPEVMNEYLSHFELKDATKWNLVTGYDQQFIKDFAKDSFKTLVTNDASSDQVVHGTSFYLINEEGTVVKSYSGVQQVPVDEIVNDMKALNK